MSILSGAKKLSSQRWINPEPAKHQVTGHRSWYHRLLPQLASTSFPAPTPPFQDSRETWCLPYAAPQLRGATSREAAGRAGPDMAEGRGFCGAAREGAKLWGCRRQGGAAAHGWGRPGVVAWVAERVPRSLSSRTSPGLRGPGVLTERGSYGNAPSAVADPTGRGARWGGSRAGLLRRCWTAGVAAPFLGKPKLLSWHVLHPEGVHPSPAGARSASRAGCGGRARWTRPVVTARGGSPPVVAVRSGKNGFACLGSWPRSHWPSAFGTGPNPAFPVLSFPSCG